MQKMLIFRLLVFSERSEHSNGNGTGKTVKTYGFYQVPTFIQSRLHIISALKRVATWTIVVFFQRKSSFMLVFPSYLPPHLQNTPKNFSPPAGACGAFLHPKNFRRLRRRFSGNYAFRMLVFSLIFLCSAAGENFLGR